MAKKKTTQTKKSTVKKDKHHEEYCPIAKFFRHLEESHDSEKPEFAKHFMKANKEFLLGVRELIDWKIEKIDKMTADKPSKRVKRVKIDT